MKKTINIALISSLLIVAACKRTLPDYGRTAAEKLSNNWWAKLQLGGADLTTPAFFTTYNNSANDSLYVDDLANLYGFKCATKFDAKGLTFGVTNAANVYYDGSPSFPASVTILDGKVLPKAGHSKSGVLTDSLYMRAIFSDDITDTFTIVGTARTGFIEDDY